MANYLWQGDPGAAGNGDWNTPQDWSPTGIPGSSDTATFALNGAYTVTGSGSAASITAENGQVTFDGALDANLLFGANDATVTLDAFAFVDLTQAVSFTPGTTLDVQGILIDASAAVDTARVDGIGANWITAGQVQANQLEISNGGTFAGNLLLNDQGSLQLDQSASFGGSTLTLAGTGAIHMASFPGAPPIGLAETIAFETAGSGLYLSADQGAVLNLAGPIGVAAGTQTLDNYLNITAGTVELSGAGNLYAGGTVVDGGATLQLDQTGGAGTGAIFLADGALVNDGVQTEQAVVGSFGSDTITGAGGGLVVFAANASTLTYVGGAEGNLVLGGAGLLNAIAGSGDTIYAGNNSQDVLRTGAGPSTIVGGGTGATLIASGGGDNLLVAGGGNTTLNGAAATGNNVMFGAASGNTTIEGGLGTDTICGVGGADTAYASAGTNDIFAGNGYLQVDFVAGFGGGTTNIVGFNTASDKLSLIGYAPNQIETALASAQTFGNNEMLTLADGSKIIFWGTTGIGAGNFV